MLFFKLGLFLVLGNWRLKVLVYVREKLDIASFEGSFWTGTVLITLVSVI